MESSIINAALQKLSCCVNMLSLNPAVRPCVYIYMHSYAAVYAERGPMAFRLTQRFTQETHAVTAVALARVTLLHVRRGVRASGGLDEEHLNTLVCELCNRRAYCAV